MNQAILELFEKSSDIHDNQNPGTVWIDFSHPDKLVSVLKTCQAEKMPLVIGTTGHAPEHIQAIKEASLKMPLVFSSNMSLGINALMGCLKMLGPILKSQVDCGITERHHRHKKDAPSGTALDLQQSLSQALELPSTAIPISALRLGDVIGEHVVVLALEHETLELKHQASSRVIYAQGALKAAAWLLEQSQGHPHFCGLYSMQQVLGF